MSTLTTLAPYIVHGIVDEINNSMIVKIPISTELDVNDSNRGKFIESVETPTIIKVIDPIKSKEKITSITYYQEGGEKDGFIYTPPGGFLKKGDEVIIFLNDSGHTWGEQGIIRVIDGKVSLPMDKEVNDNYSLEDIK